MTVTYLSERSVEDSLQVRTDPPTDPRTDLLSQTEALCSFDPVPACLSLPWWSGGDVGEHLGGGGVVPLHAHLHLARPRYDYHRRYQASPYLLWLSACVDSSPQAYVYHTPYLPLFHPPTYSNHPSVLMV